MFPVSSFCLQIKIRIMSDAWYDGIALRNGGYRNSAKYRKIGISGESVFEKILIESLKPSFSVLDAGCGHGDFTRTVARYAKEVIGFDYSAELIKIAKKSRSDTGSENVDFIFASTKRILPFPDDYFDLIYSRRGPTSIIEHSRLLKKNGVMLGIHSAAKDTVIQRLNDSGLADISIVEYPDSFMIFDDINEYAEYLAAFPGNPDFLLPEHREKLESLALENMKNGKIEIQEWRFIWKAVKK
jgi:SAM-dependent methyltransferase